jgi:uncharacterized protein (TIGR02271 family)
MTQTMAEIYEGRNVLDRDGQKIGTIDSLYLDQDGGQLEWALVNTGMFGSKRSFVLLRGASMQQDDILVPFDKQTVKNAPRVEAGDELPPDEERRLFDHYGMAYDGDGRSGDGYRGDGYRGDGHGVAAPSERPTDEAMTRSEEEMRVGTEQRERGRARLRKYVVTEHEQMTVPVRREEARIEREPIDSSNVDEATSGPAISEDEHEMTLHEERPVADTEVVPKERVRMNKETHSDDETVSADLRKERIETEGDTDRDSRR